MVEAPNPNPSVKAALPQIEKGPTVWMDMDQAELDAAYDQRVYAPMAEQILQRWASWSEETRRRIGLPRRFAYGPTSVEAMDVYAAKTPKAPVFVFSHGGAWRRGLAKDYAYPAELFNDAGITFIALDFIAVDAAGGDLRPMAQQVRSGIAWAYKNIDRYNGDPNRFYVGGHSSGAHLSGIALTTDWMRDFNLDPRFIKAGLCMSGTFDMRPVRLSQRSSYIKFDDEMEASMSAVRHIDRLCAPVTVTYGTFETPEYQRQSRDFATAAIAAGKKIELIEASHYNHFEMCESLGNPYGPNGRAALRLIRDE